MSDLKPCPCGKTPTSIHYQGDTRQKWTEGYAGCCGEWLFEFKTNYETNKAKIDKMAVEAWNALPRAPVTTEQELK